MSMKRFSFSRKPASPVVEKKEVAPPVAAAAAAAAAKSDVTQAAPAEDSHPPAVPEQPKVDPKNTSLPPVASPAAQPTDVGTPSTSTRRFSFRAFFMQDQEKKTPTSAQPKPLVGSEKRAQESALIVQSLIVGPSSETGKTVGASQLNKVKSLLMEPKSANSVIAALRTLSGSGGQANSGTAGKGADTVALPIHAVCLPLTEQEAHDQHFSQLAPEPAVGVSSFPSVTTAGVDALSGMLKNMRVVNLVTAPDLGLGQPGDGAGILAGAVPTAETVISGIVQITPELMALGYATGKALIPDHKGVYPPTDRISVLTYWWGLELVLPPPSLAYLGTVQSISGSVINFLTALSLINNGVREILPFVRYIGQFVDFEFDSIKKQNRGQGVVCAATWILPAAMVARPWDFLPPPPAPAPAPAPTAVAEAGSTVNPVPEPPSSPPTVIPNVVITAAK